MNPALFILEKKWIRSIYRFFAAILRIVPYYWMEERLFDETSINIEPRLGSPEVIFLSPTEIMGLVHHPEVPDSKREMQKRIDEGCLCLGIKHEGQLAAFCFCNPKCFRFKRIRKTIHDHEAYLFDMRTFHAYRGNNLAPYLRYQVYKKLAEKGKTLFYSLTVLMNPSSMKFKSKLGARRKKLCVYICFFSLIPLNLTLKKYKGI